MHCVITNYFLLHKFETQLPPPYDRKVWHYDRANVVLLRRSIDNLNWENLFDQNPGPNWQVQIFTETLLNIISNFVPNEFVRINLEDPPWITNHLNRFRPVTDVRATKVAVRNLIREDQSN